MLERPVRIIDHVATCWDEALSEVSDLARLIFREVQKHADIGGVAKWTPRLVWLRCVPKYIAATVEQVAEAMAELVAGKLVRVRSYLDATWAVIWRFRKYQRRNPNWHERQFPCSEEDAAWADAEDIPIPISLRVPGERPRERKRSSQRDAAARQPFQTTMPLPIPGGKAQVVAAKEIRVAGTHWNHSAEFNGSGVCSSLGTGVESESPTGGCESVLAREAHTHTEPPPTAAARGSSQFSFEEWFALYPWQVEEQQARREWQRIVASGEATPTELIAAVQAMAVRTDRPLKAPHWWLKDRNWRDRAGLNPNFAGATVTKLSGDDLIAQFIASRREGGPANAVA